MKSNTKLPRQIHLALVGLALAGSTAVSLAQSDLILNTFDSTNEITAVNNDWSGGSLYWDPNVDAGGTASRGSLHVTCNYTDQGNNWQETQVGRNIPWPYINLSPYVYIEMDIKPDTNSFPAIDGNWCEFNPVIQQWAWTPLPSTRIIGNGWTHIRTSLNPATTLAKLVCSFHRTYNAYPTNTISYWIDNVKLTVPPSPPPTMAIKPVASPGLFVMASSPGGTYQRQIIHTVNDSYSWHSPTAASNTVTYSMNIANFPGTNYAGFIAQMFLVPLYVNADPAQTNMQYGPTDSSIDWNSGSVIYWVIGQNANGRAFSDFRVKTNEFSQQMMAFNDQPGGQGGTNNTFPAGHLAALNSSSGPLGTWTLSFNNDTNVTITAPDSSVTNFVINPTWANYFQDPLYAYVGIQPNDNTRIGQSATFSRVKIDGSAMTINDDFSTLGTLDTSIWVKSAADNTGIQVVPNDGAFWLSWTTPDPGYTNIWCSSNVSAPFSTWSELTSVPQSSWYTLLDRRTALLTWSALAAVVPNTNQVFFRLWKVQGP